MNQLQAVWQTFSNTVMNSDFVKVAVSGLTGLLDTIEKIINSIGIVGTTGIIGGLLFGFKKRRGISNAVSDVIDVFNTGLELGVGRMKSFGAAAQQAGSKMGKFMSTGIGKAVGVGTALSAGAAVVSFIRSIEEEQQKARQETIDTSNTFLDSFGTFEQAYIKYADKNVLSIEEENELAAAIDGTVSALGNKSAALSEAVGASSEYASNLDSIAKAEAEQAEKSATEAKIAAKGQLDSAIKGKFLEGKPFDIKLPSVNSKEYEALKDLMEDKNFKKLISFESKGKDGILDSSWLRFSADDSIETTLMKYNAAIDMQDKLVKKANETGDEEYMATTYNSASEAVKGLNTYLQDYMKNTYAASKANYQAAHGIATTKDEFYDMREAILESAGATVQARTMVGDMINEEYMDVFDTSSIESKIDYIKSITKGISDTSSGQVGEFETLLSLRTSVNKGDCTVGEYTSQLNKVNDIIGNVKDEQTQEFLRVQLGVELDEDGNIKDQIQEMKQKFARDLTDAGFAEDAANRLVDELSLQELEAAIDISAEGKINLKSIDTDSLRAEIKKLAEFNEAMRFTIDIEGEKESLDALNTALAESRSATGLTVESMEAVKSRYAGVINGFDSSKLFQESANGVTLNAEALNEYNEAYSKTKLGEAETKLSSLKDRWSELGAKIKEAQASGDMELAESLTRQREEIRAHIAEVGELASMYEGLSSSYNEWQNAEAAGSDRSMYESVFAAQENIKKELDNGWIDDGTTEYFQLIWGEDKWDSAGKSIQDYRNKWATLDDTIAGTNYSIQDFFKTNKDGELTSEGIFNFFDAVGQKQKELGKDWIKYDDGGNIASFNFGVNGDAAIADAMGISEELVQIFLRASQDAGFTVNFDGTFTQFADMENEAQAAVASLNEIFSDDGIELSFDFSAESLDDAKSQLESAKKTFTEQGIWDSKGNFNIEADGAEEALTVVSTLQANVDRLNNKYVNIKTNDKDLQKPLEKLQDIDYKTDYLNQLKLNPKANVEEIEKVNQEISKTFDYLASDQLSQETKIKMGIEPTDTPDDVRKKYESGEIKIPASIDLQMNMDSNIQDLRDVALLGTGLLNEEQEQEILVRLGIKVEPDGEPDTTDVERSINEATGSVVEEPKLIKQPVAFEADMIELGDILKDYAPEEQDIVFKFLADPSDVENYTPEEKDTVVKFIADTLDVDGYTPEEKQAIAKFLVDGGDVSSYTPQDKEAIARYLVEGGDVDSYEPAQKEAIARFIAEHGDVDSYTPEQKTAIAKYIKDSSDPDSYVMPKNKMAYAKYLKNSKEVDSYVMPQNKHATATYYKDSSAVDGYNPPNISRSVTYTIQTVGAVLSKGVSGMIDAAKSGFGGVDGTAHAQGTAFSRGTTGKAFKQGSWGTKDSGVALMGELGQELIVRDGRWFTVGDKSAEFVGYKKDDINK